MAERPDIIKWDGDLASLADAVCAYKHELLKKGVAHTEATQLVRDFQSSIIMGATVRIERPETPGEPWE